MFSRSEGGFQLFVRFGYGNNVPGRQVRIRCEGGKGCKVTPPGQVWLPVKSTSEIIIFIIREFAEPASEFATKKEPPPEDGDRLFWNIKVQDVWMIFDVPTRDRDLFDKLCMIIDVRERLGNLAYSWKHVFFILLFFHYKSWFIISINDTENKI